MDDAPLEIASGLTAADFTTDAWLRIEKYLRARREHLRAENDGDLSPERTAKLRGRIQEIGDLLDLPARYAQWLQADSPRDS